MLLQYHCGQLQEITGNCNKMAKWQKVGFDGLLLEGSRKNIYNNKSFDPKEFV